MPQVPEQGSSRERPLIDAALRDVCGDSSGHVELRTARSTSLDLLAGHLDEAGYEIRREIHRGGQGVVYEALQRSTGRGVAVKVLRDGQLASGDERTRFELEVRVLASLNHPGIVTIHDSGDVAGYFFLVMDLVRGDPLDRYVVSEEPSVTELLELFAQLAEATAAAHLRGVIHRDLKPSNVLIDAERKPRILDFGLAKVQDPNAHADGLTQTGQFLGSIPWASPEQAAARHDLVDARTDVYALGVMLFQMLTGRFPYDVTAGILDVLRNITEAAPPRPSKLRPELGDEVDAIVLKALAKEPERRYQSASDFASDLRRLLAGLPIQAKGDSTSYILRKLASRHRVALGVAGLFIAAFVGFAVIAGGMHRRNVEMGEQMVTSETDFIAELLESANPQATDLPADEARRRIAEAESRLVDERLTPEAAATLRHAIGVSYRRLGMYADAERFLSEALAAREKLHAAPNARIAETLHELGAAHWHDARYERAETFYRRALEQRTALFGRSDPRCLDTINHLAATRTMRGDLKQAESLYRSVLEARRAALGNEHADVAASLNNLATCLHRSGAHAEAIAHFREAIAIMSTLHGEGHPFVARGLTNLAGCLAETGSAEEAERALETALRIKRTTEGPNHPSVATTLHRLAQLALDRGDFESAADRARESLDIRTAALRADHPDIASSEFVLGMALAGAGDAERAAQRLSSAYDTWTKTLAPCDPRRVDAVRAAASAMAKTGRNDRALELLETELASCASSGASRPSESEALRTSLERIREAAAISPAAELEDVQP